MYEPKISFHNLSIVILILPARQPLFSFHKTQHTTKFHFHIFHKTNYFNLDSLFWNILTDLKQYLLQKAIGWSVSHYLVHSTQIPKITMNWRMGKDSCQSGVEINDVLSCSTARSDLQRDSQYGVVWREPDPSLIYLISGKGIARFIE